MHDKTMEEIRSLLQGFEQRSLPLGAWDHAAHLSVCCWYLMKQPDRAEERMRDGIQRLNRAHGVITTPTSGYHETLTLFWIAKVRALLDVCSGSDLAVIGAVVRGLADKELVLFHYSRERIMSSVARRQWCEPDLRRLPAAEGMPTDWPHRHAGRESGPRSMRTMCLSAL